MVTPFRSPFRAFRLGLLIFLQPVLHSVAWVDTITLGDPSSERAHALVATQTEVITGGLDIPARRLLPLTPEKWHGGSLAFTLKVDPVQPTYLTVRLWGSDFGSNRLMLLCDGKVVGYAHLGDVEILDLMDPEPPYAGRFTYNTTPLPLAATQGKTTLNLEIRGIGSTHGFGDGFEKFQGLMKEPSRGLYAVYTHTDTCLPLPAAEKQGVPPDAPVRSGPGPEVLDQLKARINGEIATLLASKRPLGQGEMQFLGKAYQVKWTTGYHNPELVKKIVQGLDALYLAYAAKPDLAKNGPDVANSGWLGLGPAGDAARQLGDALKPFLKKPIDGSHGITRRQGWADMLVASRDWHRRHRPQYTNQSMITDLNTYYAHRGVAAIDPARALPEKEGLRYLYESLGIEPWLGSDTDHGPDRRLGDHYYQVTAKGLTRELGYVGYYGEVLDWVTHIYNATCLPGQPRTGDARIREQLIKMEQARAPFRYPALDAEGNRAMRIETMVGWRDAHHPGAVVYAERSAWEGSAIYSAAATLEPRSTGYVQQMLADNQFFASVADLIKDGGIRVSQTLLPLPDDYETLRRQPVVSHRLPMTPGQPDFVFSDEEDGVVAFKDGENILYISLYWRARYAVNFLARVHHLTPNVERIALVREDVTFTPSGQVYRRPDWIAFGFGNGGPRYPEGLKSALEGEELPIAKVTNITNFEPGQENGQAGKGDFYVLRYGDYLIAMNTTADKTYDLKIPADIRSATNLTVGAPTPAPGSANPVGPRSTIILRLSR